ncbi:MAG: DUF2871 family protein, partial [Clostridium celatum]|nr:DUF2871 family protein [Clostridium celatum]
SNFNDILNFKFYPQLIIEKPSVFKQGVFQQTEVFNISNIKYFIGWLITYNIGLLSLISTLVVRGILEVLNKDFIGLPHIAGTAHAILGISLIWFMIILKKSIFTK